MVKKENGKSILITYYHFLKILDSHKKGYKLICLACNDDKYDWCDVLIQQSELSVFEWLGLFKYAEKVVTSTYHGLMFGLIFNKPLAFCKSDFIVAKAESFLKKIGLYGYHFFKGKMT